MMLSQFEIDLLRALLRDEKPGLNSAHRLRLEMKSLVSDGADGLRLTKSGEQAARTESAFQHETLVRPEGKVDAKGRRKMLERGHAIR